MWEKDGKKIIDRYLSQVGSIATVGLPSKQRKRVGASVERKELPPLWDTLDRGGSSYGGEDRKVEATYFTA